MSLFSPYVLIAIVVSVLGAYGGGRLQQYTRDQSTFQKKVDAMVAQAAADKAAEEARQRNEAAAAEAAAATKEKSRARQMAAAQARIAALSTDLAATRVASVGGLLNRSIGDSSLFAGPAAKPSEKPGPVAASADTTVGDWVRWSQACIDTYNAVRDQVIGWQQFYGKLRGG